MHSNAARSPRCKRATSSGSTCCWKECCWKEDDGSTCLGCGIHEKGRIHVHGLSSGLSSAFVRGHFCLPRNLRKPCCHAVFPLGIAIAEVHPSSHAAIGKRSGARTMAIRDTSATDRPIENNPSRRKRALWIGGA